MKCREIIEVLEALAPVSIACDWDNPGLLAGRADKEVKRILLALDATDEVVEEAVEVGADLLLTHHPLIFKAVKKVNDQDFIGRRLVKLIQKDISYYAMHTNFDAAPGCMADLAAERLKLRGGRPLERMGTVNLDDWVQRLPGLRPELTALKTAADEAGAREVEYGIGKVGVLPEAVTVEELARTVKRVFDIPFVTVYKGGAGCNPVVKRVAICPGAGGSTLNEALRQGAEVYITGDISHHEGIDAVANQMAVIDAGHYGVEHIFMEFMEPFLREHLGEAVEIRQAAAAFPSSVV